MRLALVFTRGAHPRNRRTPRFFGRQPRLYALRSFEPQTDALDGVFVVTAFQRVARTAKAESPFCRRTLDSCDREILCGGRGETPSLETPKRAMP